MIGHPALPELGVELDLSLSLSHWAVSQSYMQNKKIKSQFVWKFIIISVTSISRPIAQSLDMIQK